MENFSAKRLLINVLLLLMAVFMVIAGINRLVSFLKTNNIKVVNEKVADYPVYKQVKGDVFFISLPVVASTNGEIEKLQGNFAYVEKGELIGRIKNKDYSVDIISPGEGLLLWGNLGTYISSPDMLKDKNIKGCNFSLTGKKVKEGKVICSVVDNDVFYVRLPVNKESIFVYNSGFTVKGIRKFSIGSSALYSFSQYLKYFLDNENFMVLDDLKKGIKVKSNIIVKKGNKEGIFIVQGNVIKFVSVSTYPMIDGYKLVVGNFTENKNSVIVIATPHLVHNGEIFNE